MKEKIELVLERGDVLRCVQDEGDAQAYTVGNLYIVMAEHGDTHLSIQDDSGDNHSWTRAAALDDTRPTYFEFVGELSRLPTRRV